MKKIFFMAIAAIALCGCAEHSHKTADAHEEHAHIHSYTAYTRNVEFFMQHEGLATGEKSCITLFATDLATFKPVAGKTATATIKVGDNSQSMTVETANAGVFHFDIVPSVAGDGLIFFEAGGEKAHFDICVTDGHDHNHDAHAHSHEDGHGHDEAHGHNHGDAHSHSHEHDHEGHHHHAPHLGHGVETNAKSGDVSLTKEQSWKIDFATEEAAVSTFGGVVKVAARAEAQPGDFTTIVATTSGKVQFAANIVEGMSVSSGSSLFYLEGSDVTDNDAAVKYAEAESHYELAKADYERKKHLFIEKVVSEREYQAAEAAYRQAEARFTSMKRNFGSGKVTLKSSIDGCVSTILVANGDYVQPGTPLAIVQRNGGVNLVAELPVRYASQLQDIAAVNVETAQGVVYNSDSIGAVAVVGKVANSCNMLPVTVSADAVPGVVTGSIVALYISSAAKEHGVAVPRSALVEEMGNMFVFVQSNPVSFEKRSVKVGATDGRYVRLLEGVHPGERVVSKGGIILKLSQGASALDPHAGHVH